MRKLFLFIAAVMCAASMSLTVQAEILTFNFEGDNPTIPAEWVNDETYPWTVVNNAPEGFGGTYCIKSGNSGVGSSSSTLEATFTFIGDGSISFDAGCWGEGTSTPWDSCCFYIDDVLLFHLGAVQSWEHWSFTLTAGTHTFRWIYWKDSSVDPPVDAFFVDNIVVDLGTLPPTVEEDGWVHYTNWQYGSNLCWDSNGFQWGIMIPGGTVEKTYLTALLIYVNSEYHGDAIVYIYQGGTTPADATLLHEQEVSLTANNDFPVISMFPSVPIDPSKDTWIVLSANWQAASYCSMEVSSSNGRWIATNDIPWSDVKDVNPGYEDIAWMIYGIFESEPMPYAINILANDITSTSANLTWGGSGTFELRYKKHISHNTDFSEWTTIDADRDGYNWEVQPEGYCISNSYKNGVGVLTPDNYLVSPRLTIGDSIKFEALGVDMNDFAEHFGVAVSTTSNTDPGAFTTINDATIDEGNTWKKYTFDLSAYKGQDGYVAIRHFDCTNQLMLWVKNVKFYPLPDPEPEWTVISNLNEAAYALSELEPGQEYWVEVKAFYGEEATNWSRTYKFFTLKEDTGIEQIVESQKSKVESRKILHNGELYILRGEEIFNAQGARVK